MNISISGKNEVYFYPKIENNLELAEKDRFCIVLRKLNRTMHADKWARYSEGDVQISLLKRIQAHMIRLINPPTLQLEDGTEKALTIENLLNEEYSELFSLLVEINDFIQDNLIDDTGIETKK
jgi:hypothetical protein